MRYIDDFVTVSRVTGFLKIDTQTLTSTTYADKPAWDVFFAAMLIAAQYKPLRLDEPMAQMAVRTLETTGWMIPPGEYGFAPAAGVGIVKTAQIDTEMGLEALERLGAPEPDSRSQIFDGRRLVRIDGGYVVLNMMEFRQRDQTATERQRRRRARIKAEKEGVTRDVTVDAPSVTDADAEEDANAEAEGRGRDPIPSLHLPGETQGAFLERELTLVLNNGFGTLGFDPTKYTYQAAIRLIQNEKATLEQIRDAIEGWNAGRRPDGIDKLSMFQAQHWAAVRAACLAEDPDEPAWKKELTS